MDSYVIIGHIRPVIFFAKFGRICPKKRTKMSQNQLPESPTQEVVAKVNQLGLTKAAKALGTSPASLSRWLNRNGYFSKPQYVRKEKPTHKFQPA